MSKSTDVWLSKLKENCRWHSNGQCKLIDDICTGYDIYECGDAEELDDCNPHLNDSDYWYE